MREPDELTRRALALAAEQGGMIARRQLLSLGFTAAQAYRDVESRRWRVVLRGVYASHTGPLPALSRIWAAVLYGGGGAAAGRETALWMAGVLDRPPQVIHLAIPFDRQLTLPEAIRAHRHRGLAAMIQPDSRPPRLQVEHALLDACDAAPTVDACLTLIFATIQRRVTTPQRIRSALDGRLRISRRELIGAVLHDAERGVTSALERLYLNDVERRHGLPDGERNEPETTAKGKTVYRDVRYLERSMLVELDGREAHPPEKRFQDRRRDNDAMVFDADATLRYGWHDVAGRPCEVAWENCVMLRRHGWPGWGRPCGPTCHLSRPPPA